MNTLSQQLKPRTTGVFTNNVAEMIAHRIKTSEIEAGGGVRLYEKDGELFIKFPDLPVRPRQITKKDGTVSKLVSLVDATDYDVANKRPRSLFVTITDVNGQPIQGLLEIKVLYPGELSGLTPAKESPVAGQLLEGPSDKTNTDGFTSPQYTEEDRRALGIQD